ncbi:uncharacterized protein PHALS_01821 [Plasmopara halstedii]|uniref:Uncharacterized protein n=1 Tax=Plasmopara halstedii TaxID=4781 RepID=A0A0N7L6Y0_PLAHL|nr:uncharacterized protein PHALS_01821 [Plasmopara halstedii]CEG45531.1 hypothetical protein PHALS_01821 [Plasmopara halstedii]|eukprot:XP_024581900.1 hypothetical protein PHALS_01821 [Plasmopara halstedii]
MYSLSIARNEIMFQRSAKRKKHILFEDEWDIFVELNFDILSGPQKSQTEKQLQPPNLSQCG